MKKRGLLGWLLLVLALLGAFMLLMYGSLVKAAWYAMGSDDTSKKQKAALDAAAASVDAMEKAKPKG